MVSLVLDRRVVVQRRVPSVRVVPAFDELEDRHPGLVSRLEPGPLQQLAFERPEERLAHGIVVAVPDGPHRGPDPRLLAAMAEADRGVLTALVRVVDHVLRLSLVQRHRERRDDQLRPKMRLHAPAHDPATEHVEHHGQEQEALPGRDVRDIRHPELVRPFRREVPAHEIRRRLILLRPPRGRNPATPRGPRQTQLFHEPLDPLPAHPSSQEVELRPDPRRSVRPTRARVDLSDLLAQGFVLELPLGLGPLRPGVKAAGGHPEQPAHPANRVLGLVSLYELERREEGAPTS